jgi:hypothetical protein
LCSGVTLSWSKLPEEIQFHHIICRAWPISSISKLIFWFCLIFIYMIFSRILFTILSMTGHATRRCQKNYVSFLWIPQANRTCTWNLFRRCWAHLSPLITSCHTPRRQSLFSLNYCARVRDKRSTSIFLLASGDMFLVGSGPCKLIAGPVCCRNVHSAVAPENCHTFVDSWKNDDGIFVAEYDLVVINC